VQRPSPIGTAHAAPRRERAALDYGNISQRLQIVRQICLDWTKTSVVQNRQESLLRTVRKSDFGGHEKSMSKKTWKEWSKSSFLTESENPTMHEIQIACLQRIADATEAMAKPFVKMTEDLAWYSKERTRLLNENQHLRNRIAGHKAAFTKLKNKLEATNEDEN
jgi:hypothetical protein